MAIPNGKCLNCQQVIPDVAVEPIGTQKPLAGGWNAICFLCPFCRTILGVQLDPVAIRQDIVESVSKANQGVQLDLAALRQDIVESVLKALGKT